MLKRDYFLEALRNGAYKYKIWVLHAFSHTKLEESTDFPYRLLKQGKQYYFNHPESNEPIILEDSDSSKPPFNFRERFNLKAEEVPNLHKDIESNYGQLLANWVVLVYPFTDKIDYVEGEFSIGAVEKQIHKRLTTNPEFQTPKSFKAENPIYVSEFLTYLDALLSLNGYSQLCIPGASAKSLVTDPQVAVRRKELLKEYEGRLGDPVVVAKIEAELVAMDKAWIKGDISEGFYRKDKMFEGERKKMHVMQGYSTGFGLEPTTITTPLSEGWTAEQLPGMMNSAREGAYGRGKMTALGGAATKTVNRMFQNVSLIHEDCGTKIGWVRILTPESIKTYYGFYFFNKDGTTEILSEANASKVLNKPTMFRSPQFCKIKGINFCKYCVGDVNAENENALGASVAAMTSQTLQISLSAVHTVALKATTYKPTHAID
jgi:hypothetical protein